MSRIEEIDPYRLLIDSALPLWPATDGAAVSLLNVSENIMYRVDTTRGDSFVLRVHRQNNNSAAIRSELAWMSALQIDNVLRTPDVVFGINGQAIQSVTTSCPESMQSAVLHLVMFVYIQGREPTDADDLLSQFSNLGGLAARSHNHSSQWPLPDNFERGSWNTDTLLGSDPVWGCWKNAPGVDKTMHPLLSLLCETVIKRLNQLGRDKSIYGLIHADMRRANLLVHNNETRLIDFDDCGFGWYLYDFATAVSFIEDHPRLSELKSAWLQGYRQWRQPSTIEVDEIDTLMMLRRMALLAWMGGHTEVPIVQELQGRFAAVTCKLGEVYLAGFNQKP